MAKVIKTGILHRSFTLERSAIDADKRTVDLSFSSELPVERWFGNEILDHNPESVDLSRLRGAGPLLMDHNTRDQIGVVESANLRDKTGRATVRFGSGARAQEIFKDVQDGIRTLVSVGYRVNTLVTEKVEKGVETMRATSWTPMEISIVSIPADPSVGIGRKVDDEQFETRVETLTDNNNMPEQAPIITEPVAGRTQVAAPASLNMPTSMMKESIQEIRAITAQHAPNMPGLKELAMKAEIEDWAVARFRAAASQLVPEGPKVSTQKNLEIPKNDLEWYSLTRAINALCSNEKLSGIERELSDEITKRSGRSPNGFWIPPQVMAHNMYRTVQTVASGAVGAFVVETQNLGDQFIELLRNRAQVMALGARTINLTEPTTIPRQASAGTANWVAETAATTPSTLGLTQITLSPKCVTAHMQYGKQLLITSNPSIDNMLRDDITNVIALQIDSVSLQGGGVGEPVGIMGSMATANSLITGTDGVALATYAPTLYSAAVSLETLLSSGNADMGSLAYIVRPTVRGRMKITQRFSSTDSPVWTSGFTSPGAIPSNGSNDGILNGYRAAVTNQVKNTLTVGTATTIATAIFFGNFNELLIAQFNGGAVDLVVDPYVLAANRIVRLIASYWCDVGVRHPESFSMLNGIL